MLKVAQQSLRIFCHFFWIKKQCFSGHAYPGDTAHTLPLSLEELRRRFAKPYDPAHTAGQQRPSATPLPAPIQGRGGRGGRGRGGRSTTQPNTGKGGRARPSIPVKAGTGHGGAGATAKNGAGSVDAAAKQPNSQMRGGSAKPAAQELAKTTYLPSGLGTFSPVYSSKEWQVGI